MQENRRFLSSEAAEQRRRIGDGWVLGAVRELGDLYGGSVAAIIYLTHAIRANNLGK
jgi:hypothetical protein